MVQEVKGMLNFKLFTWFKVIYTGLAFKTSKVVIQLFKGPGLV